MNLNWAVGLLIAAVGNVVIPRQNDDMHECLEPGCTRRFMTARGRRKHFRTVHQGIRKRRESCKHGCGKTYAFNQKARLHERTCERNPNR